MEEVISEVEDRLARLDQEQAKRDDEWKRKESAERTR